MTRLKQRHAWFEKFDGIYAALWWVPAGPHPDVIRLHSGAGNPACNRLSSRFLQRRVISTLNVIRSILPSFSLAVSSL